MTTRTAVRAKDTLRQVLSLTAIAALAAGLALTTTAPAHAADVVFDDTTLQACANNAIDPNRPSNRIITDAEAVQVTSLYCDSKGITKLTGLEAFTGLGRLNLNDNSITDISALQKLTGLSHLGLASNSITDISALAALTNLNYLGLSDQSRDLGSLRIGKARANPVVNEVDPLVALSGGDLYDAQANTFTPTGQPGTGTPQTWNTQVTIGNATTTFSGELTYTQYVGTDTSGSQTEPKPLAFTG